MRVVLAAGFWALAGAAGAATVDVPGTGPVAVPADRGPLQFAAGSHQHDLGRAVGIG